MRRFSALWLVWCVACSGSNLDAPPDAGYSVPAADHVASDGSRGDAAELAVGDAGTQDAAVVQSYTDAAQDAVTLDASQEASPDATMPTDPSAWCRPAINPGACGSLNEACCDGGTCGSNMVCSSCGTCTTRTCGTADMACCPGDTCDGTSKCTDGLCTQCGGDGQPCCPTPKTPCRYEACWSNGWCPL